ELNKYDYKLKDESGQSLLTAKEAKISPKEEADIATVVNVEDDLIKKAVDSNRNESLGKNTIREIEKNHKDHLDKAITSIEERVNEKKLNSYDDLQNYYSLLEVVSKNNGEKISGAIVTQVGDVMILHSPKGAVRISKDEIAEIGYFKFDVKVKKRK
ncbi:MAG: hypothetical protein K8R21_07925, partial [Leptospira sp.]|nr:hypothetical protein [Leptospira sp.]